MNVAAQTANNVHRLRSITGSPPRARSDGTMSPQQRQARPRLSEAMSSSVRLCPGLVAERGLQADVTAVGIADDRMARILVN